MKGPKINILLTNFPCSELQPRLRTQIYGGETECTEIPGVGQKTEGPRIFRLRPRRSPQTQSKKTSLVLDYDYIMSKNIKTLCYIS